MSSPVEIFGLSSSLGEQLMMMSKNQGTLFITGSDCDTIKCPSSLRRTLSADMSSKKWISQQGLCTLKKTASSQQLISITDSSSASSSSSEGEDYYEEIHQPQSDIWGTILEDNKNEAENPGQLDTWSSILSQKSQEDPKNVPPPYVHPLVKRSASCLSAKSLEICTESLGSETGSDGFSSYPPSETGDTEDDKEQQAEEKVAFEEDCRVAKYNLAAASSKKSPPKSFPPPIPSLSSRDGASVHMRSRRDNGRLVLEAVSVPSQKNFRAQRQDGRLVLTFINMSNEEEEEDDDDDEEEEVEPKSSKANSNEVDQFESELDNCEEEKEDEEKAELIEEEETEQDEEVENDGEGGGAVEEMRFVMELAPNLSSGVLSVQKLMMSKSMVLTKRNPTWPKKFNTPVKFEEEDEEEEVVAVKPMAPLTQSLPPRPPVARMVLSPQKTAVTATGNTAAASFNAYEYYWKPKAIAGTARVLNPTARKPSSIAVNINNYNYNNNKLIVSKTLMGNDQQEMVVLRGNNGDYLVPFCKELRRTFLFWEPYYIATS
ncbi:hypothetical protein K2173_021154 [Erythroxylum novogranatense]|uniref:FAF domain-containing protein n=1 Tax=Erythroxylum novogranatense TaxID=1862640 RepID=A0AAV8TQ44_9ROSI|nr:hypothetical protein K2173_021154 [Erythroxylum novogranatense]